MAAKATRALSNAATSALRLGSPLPRLHFDCRKLDKVEQRLMRLYCNKDALVSELLVRAFIAPSRNTAFSNARKHAATRR